MPPLCPLREKKTQKQTKDTERHITGEQPPQFRQPHHHLAKQKIHLQENLSAIHAQISKDGEYLKEPETQKLNKWAGVIIPGWDVVCN